MTTQLALPNDLPLSLTSCCSLAAEVWRLKRQANALNNTQDGLSLRYTARQLSRLLEELELVVVDLSGRPYDPGMIQEVLEVRKDPTMPEGQVLIDETISPTVTWRGSVVQAGQVSLRRSASSISIEPEVSL